MKADIHIHTKFSSDAVSSPEEIVDSAIEKGVGCICITDHGQIKGAIAAMKYGYDKNILIVPGIEILSKSGDILGVGVKKIIPNGLSAEETIKGIRKQGGIAIVPHPFDRPFMGFSGGKKIIKAVNPDAVEVFNASVIFRSSNRKALNFVRENNFCFTAGSDAHRKDYVGRGYIDIPSSIKSEKDLVNAIFAKNAKPKGRHLSIIEILKNGSNANVREMVRYCRFRRKYKGANHEMCLKN